MALTMTKRQKPTKRPGRLAEQLAADPLLRKVARELAARLHLIALGISDSDKHMALADAALEAALDLRSKADQAEAPTQPGRRGTWL